MTYISDFARFLGFSAVTSLTNEKLQRLDHNLPPYGRTIRFFPDRLGQGVKRQTRDIAESLRSLGFEFQQRFELAEISAKLLAETVGPPGERLAKALGDSYASKAVINVRLQLYRALIIDLCAAFLDRHRRACSIRSIIDKLERSPNLIRALQEYRSNPNAYEITIEPPIGEGPLAEQVVRRATDLERQMLSANLGEGITTEWRNIKMRSDLLTKTEAERLKWIRDKAIAHWECRADGLVPLSEQPWNARLNAPFGSGPLSWVEPLDFLSAARPLAYDVIALLTATRWSKDFDKAHEFYACVFWDRFAKGHLR